MTYNQNFTLKKKKKEKFNIVYFLVGRVFHGNQIFQAAKGKKI